MGESRVGLALLLVGAMALFGRAAVAVELNVSTPGMDEKFNDFIRGATLSAQTIEQEDAKVQDYIAAARADYARIVSALYEAGFYGGVISIRVDGREAADIPPISRPRAVNRIDMVVEPGPVFTFSRAQITPKAPLTEIPEGFRAGQRASSALIVEAADASVERWRIYGHAKAEITDQNITANHSFNTLDVDIRLAPGPQLRFGDLNITEPSYVRAARIREIAGLPGGELFSPYELEQAGKRLRRTGAFRSVALEEAEEIGPGSTIDIDATVVDAEPRRIGLGAEVSSLEGLGLSGFWLHRNLFGGAERFRIDAEISGIGGDSGGIDYLLSTRFERPATLTPDTDLYLSALAEQLDDPDYRENRVQIGGGFIHRFNDKLTGEIGVAYQYSDIRDDLGSRTLEHILFPGKLTFDKRDDELNAKEGFYVDLDLTPFVGIDNNSAGARFYLDARTYVSFGEDNRFTIANRAQIGSVSGASLTEVPPDMLFFSGGAGTVRGQDYQSLAVNLPGMTRLGGRSFLGLSSEFRAQIRREWSAVAFVDTGFVGQDSWGTENGDWHSGAGFGVRYHTSVGPIRVDLATPLGGNAGEDVEIYIGIGQAF